MKSAIDYRLAEGSAAQKPANSEPKTPVLI